jgi:hypothetical protein
MPDFPQFGQAEIEIYFGPKIANQRRAKLQNGKMVLVFSGNQFSTLKDSESACFPGLPKAFLIRKSEAPDLKPGQGIDTGTILQIVEVKDCGLCWIFRGIKLGIAGGYY